MMLYFNFNFQLLKIIFLLKSPIHLILYFRSFFFNQKIFLEKLLPNNVLVLFLAKSLQYYLIRYVLIIIKYKFRHLFLIFQNIFKFHHIILLKFINIIFLLNFNLFVLFLIQIIFYRKKILFQVQILVYLKFIYFFIYSMTANHLRK